jgi:DNA-binding transcriptional ArsR family regulator
MDIWDKGPKRVIRYLLSSTADVRCFGEIAAGSSLSDSAVTSVLGKFVEAGIVLRKVEGGGYAGESEFRAARVYYPLNPNLSQDAISILQMGMKKPRGSTGSFEQT